MAIINGWGRGTWGQLGWGTALPVNITTAGVATSAIGSLTVDAAANVTAPSLAITSGIGDTQVIAAAIVQVTGLSASSAISSVTISGKANVVTAGVATTSALGSPQLVTNNFLSVAGLSTTSALGTVTPTAAAGVTLIGLTSVTIDLGVTLVYGEIDTNQDPNYNVISDQYF